MSAAGNQTPKPATIEANTPPLSRLRHFCRFHYIGVHYEYTRYRHNTVL